MRNFIQLIILAFIGLISYNYFYGNAVEKARSEKVIHGVKEVFVSLKELAIAEKEKLDAGKYDKALDKLDVIFQKLKAKGSNISEELSEKLTQLEQEKKDFNRQIQEKDHKNWTKKEQTQAKEDFEALIKKTENLFKEVQAQ